MLNVETKIIVGASAYACIKYSGDFNGDWHCGTIDMRLPGGRGAPADLVRIASEHRERAARELRFAAIAEAAAAQLSANGA